MLAFCAFAVLLSLVRLAIRVDQETLQSAALLVGLALACDQQLEEFRNVLASNVGRK